MLLIKPTQVNNGSIEFDVNESIQYLFVQVMYNNTAENMHNLLWGQNSLVSMSVKTRQSTDQVMCNGIPLLRLLNFSAYDAGHFQFLHSFDHNGGNENKIGVRGLITLADNGNLRLSNDQDKVHVKISDLPVGSWVSVHKIEGRGFDDYFCRYKKQAVNGEENERTIDAEIVDCDALLVPIGESVEKPYNFSPNSYNNPLDFLQLFYNDGNTPDRRLDVESIKIVNMMEEGRDLVALWTKGKHEEPPYQAGIAITPNFQIPEIDPNIRGYFDYGLIDLDDVAKIVVFKKTTENGDFPYFIKGNRKLLY